MGIIPFRTRKYTRENPYPCTWVRVFTGMGTDRVKPTHGLPMSYTTCLTLPKSWIAFPTRQKVVNRWRSRFVRMAKSWLRVAVHRAGFLAPFTLHGRSSNCHQFTPLRLRPRRDCVRFPDRSKGLLRTYGRWTVRLYPSSDRQLYGRPRQTVGCAALAVMLGNSVLLQILPFFFKQNNTFSHLFNSSYTLFYLLPSQQPF